MARKTSSGQGRSWTARGYPRLVKLQGAYQEVAIFRRFGTLNQLSLLSMQAELLDLEDQLQECVRIDNDAESEKTQSLSTDFWQLHHSRDFKQRRLLQLQIRPKLQQYNDFLLQLSSIDRLQKPERFDLQTLRKWLEGDQEGQSFLTGVEYETWDEAHDKDFVTINNESPTQGVVSQWLNPKLVDWYYSSKPKAWVPRFVDIESGRVHDTDDSKAVRSCRFISKLAAVIIASLIPALAILVLQHVPDVNNRIYITIGLTAALGLCLGTFTNATTKEIFGATAAFAAVEVVFIGSATAS